MEILWLQGKKPQTLTINAKLPGYCLCVRSCLLQVFCLFLTSDFNIAEHRIKALMSESFEERGPCWLLMAPSQCPKMQSPEKVNDQ